MTARALTYNADLPAFRQRQDWTCSVNSIAWCVSAVGRPISAAAMQDLMVDAGLVTRRDGEYRRGT